MFLIKLKRKKTTQSHISKKKQMAGSDRGGEAGSGVASEGSAGGSAGGVQAVPVPLAPAAL